MQNPLGWLSVAFDFENKLETPGLKGKVKELKRQFIIAVFIALTSSAFAQEVSSDFEPLTLLSLDSAIGKISQSERSVFCLSNSATSEGGTVMAVQPFSGSGEWTVRIRELRPATAKVGIVFRGDTNVISPYAAMVFSGSNVVFQRVLVTNELPVVTIQAKTNATWLRIIREGEAISGFFSEDGKHWTQISADSLEMPEKIFAGFALFEKGEVVFDQIQVTCAQLSNPPENKSFLTPTNLLLTTSITSSGNNPRRVEFFEQATKLGEANHYPFAFTWTNSLAGSRVFTAKVTDAFGVEFFTKSIGCEIKLPETKVKFVSADDATRGDWKDNYGREGFQIVRYATNLPFYADTAFSGQKNIVLAYPSDLGGLQFTNGAGRIASHWFTYTNMTISVGLLDGNAHQVALYCYDSDSAARVQTVEVIDPLRRSVLDQRRVTEFSKGRYLVWEIQGKVDFRISHVAGGPSVVSGIFFDSPPPSNTKESH